MGKKVLVGKSNVTQRADHQSRFGRLPDFAVIGAQKAGSTYLLNCLRGHPQIFMPASEIMFCEVEPLEGDALVRFARHFMEARPEQVVGVKRPNLLGTPMAPERLSQALPHCKLIVILRHPVERAISGYFHYMATGLLPIVPAAEGLDRLLRGDLSASYPRGREVLEFGLYGRHLTRYAEWFPREQIRVVLLDDVRRGAEQVLRDLFAFLQVETDFDSPAKQEKPMQTPYSLTRLRIRRWMYEGSRIRPAGSVYYQARNDWVAKLQRGAARFVDQWLLRPIFGNRPPQLPPSLWERLAWYYAEDIVRLEQLLGRSLIDWRKNCPEKIDHQRSV